MKELFSEILAIDEVKGVMLFSLEGDLVFKDFSPSAGEFDTLDSWDLFSASLKGIREADLVFENVRLYARKTSSCAVIIVMGIFAPIAMVRLNCDILLPTLKDIGKAKGLKRLIKWKK